MYIAINAYRSSASDGPANTWQVYTCSPREQRALLTIGLPVRDQWCADGAACYSTYGVRLATRAEIRAARRSAYGVARYSDVA